MEQSRTARSIEGLKRIALSLERLAAEGVASGAVHGATTELQSAVPEVDFQQVARELVTTLGQLSSKLSALASSPEGSWLEPAVASAVRGAVTGLSGSLPVVTEVARDSVARLNAWLDHAEQELESPADRARRRWAGGVEGFTDELGRQIPRLTPMAAQLGEEVADRLGRALVHALAAQLRSELVPLLPEAGQRLRASTVLVSEQAAHAVVRGAARGVREALHRPAALAWGAVLGTFALGFRLARR